MSMTAMLLQLWRAKSDRSIPPLIVRDLQLRLRESDTMRRLAAHIPSVFG